MSAKRRIVHIISSLESGGCENMLLRTLPLLNDAEFEQVVVTLFRPGQLALELKARGVRVIYPGGLGRLLPLLSELEPALIITYLFHADMIGRLFVQPRTKMPVIAFLRTTYNFSRYLPARIAERLTKQFARYYIANSQAVKEYYVREIGVTSERIMVIPNGIDVTVFDEVDGAVVRAELGVPKDRFVITCVANLARNKGHRYLLEAFEAFARIHRTSWLLLVGAGEEEQQLKQQVMHYTSKERIVFLGRRRDVAAVLAATDAFVLPTLFEGMSNAILEAMAAGLPVITTDIPENRVLITNEQNGVLVPRAETHSIHAALELLYADGAHRQQLGRAARATINRQFQLPVVVAQWRQMLREWAVA